MASALDLTLDLFKSPHIRTAATGAISGSRSIGGDLTEDEEEGGLLAPLWNALLNIGRGIAGGLVKVGGFLLNTLMGGFRFTWTALVAQLQSASMFLWNFNFNATDTELDATYANFLTILGGQLGGTIGNAIGWLTCGAVPGLVLMKFNKVLAARVLAEVGEEALDELVGNLRVLVLQAQQLQFRWTTIQAFKSGRRVIKEVLRDPGSPMARLFMMAGGDLQKVREWGDSGRKPWSFAIALDTWIESIKSDFWQNFTEELIEEFFDSCSEAFYVVANAADQYALEKGVEGQALLGPEEVIEIQPNRNNPEERIILAGPQNLVAPTIVQTMTHHQMLHERSIGNFMGETIEGLANREIRTLMARLVFSSSQIKKSDLTTVTLFNVDRTKLDWENLKQAMGGINGYMWGPWSVQASLDDESVIRIWANTEAEGFDRITALSQFVTGEILTANSYHEMREGKRITYDTLRKEPRRQYPWELLIINPIQILNEENGKTTKKGIYKDRQALLPLWTDERPDEWSETLQELFATPGPNEI
jgi:hypothetical protein